jgi:hypothetical protein
MARTGRLLLGLVIAASLPLVLVLAGIAAGSGAGISSSSTSVRAGAFVYRSSTTNPPLGDHKRKVGCPGGNAATGGGVNNHGVFYKTLINSIYPTAAGGWGAHIGNENIHKQKETVWAVCSSLSRTVVTATFASPPSPQNLKSGSTTSGSAMCPGSKHVTGGGVLGSQHDLHQKIRSSFPVDGSDGGATPDDGWRGSVNNTTNSVPDATFTVYAICANVQPVYRSRRKIADVDLPSSQSASCEGRHVIGGGLRVSAKFNRQLLHSSYPADGSDADSAPDDSWVGAVDTVSHRKPHHYRVFAICL